MSSDKQITLYYSKMSVNVHRVCMALEEAKLSYKTYPIQIAAPKPAWYLEKINPKGLIPAITYGGPDVPGDHPSPSATVITESPIIMEFIADLRPHAGLLPADPVARAKVRMFIDTVNTQLVPAFLRFLKEGASYEPVLDGVRAVQRLLPEYYENGNGTWAVGDTFTIADIAAAPFVARVRLPGKYSVGKYAAGEERLLQDALDSPEFARFKAYGVRLFERPSFKATYDEDHIVSEWRRLLA
ncbi:glutathione S-transferase C-terminal-like protein [Coniophora puteana RWD-64-598 SS2]|uniref:Glutathione S-transferase C-terminal-like protein n=1 Tax=Coniophora puteana (strain RWD-64-598) TaxID=741705 RepID=A0A5M3N0W9_CONPW|nr:glutathione S-transferase C-terminal-like protein [Coniophora puteana RWD-64-598 SS2]EIW84545.1 glutathione S-transferase C-terminal-like protein [Coniophora puteana RWD-64-598 SS2]